MKTWILGLAIIVGGCNKNPEEMGSHDTDTTITRDTDSGGTDTSGDTGGDTAVSTCDPATSLTFTAEVRDATTGAVITTATTHDTPTAAGVVTSTCPTAIRFETDTTCLVKSWTITGPHGAPVEIDPVCNPVLTSWTMPADSKQEATTPLTAMSKGTYTIDVLFGYQDMTATTTLTIQ